MEACELPQAIHPSTRRQWRAWLTKNHQQTSGIWLVSYKKAAQKPTLSYDDIVEEALCFGWIDSKPNKVDDLRTKLWLAPRKAKSGWSKPNKTRIEKLIADGLMQPAGLAKINAARADGSWQQLDAVEALEIPDDLRAALQNQAPAESHFLAFPKSTKRGILEWINNAKREQTRAQRIAETARLAKANQRANQYRPKPEAT
jgi:uncharacterized protein YdeI (YjbR/CyaY-like superfamily)